MANLPTICESCGTVYPSPIGISDCPEGLIFARNMFGPCPSCGGNGYVLEGTIAIAGDIINILAGTGRTKEQLRSILDVVVDARSIAENPSAAVDKIKAGVPELRSIVDSLPKTRNELYGALTLIIAVITLLFTGATYFESHKPSVTETNEMIEQSIEEAYQPKMEVEPSNSNKPGTRRIDPCICGSGKKYKYCCGKLV